METAAAASTASPADRPAALRYASDTEPGLRRHPRGKGFAYRDDKGRAVRDRATVSRIRALAIPPAWTDVWICADDDGHIQATGRDARGRKQYRYHADWTAHRSDTKYARLATWADRLAVLRRTVARDLRRPALDRDRVVATVVALLDESSMRIGNSEYAKHNKSFGLTTLRDRHAKVSQRRIRFTFRGKSGVEHDVAIDNPTLARIVRRCQELPGQHLFQYLDDHGQRHPVSSNDVNAYIRACAGDDYSAKDLRTWRGTVIAAEALSAMPPPASAAEGRRQKRAAAKVAARELGNTVAVCLACYIHPRVFDAHVAGTLARDFAANASARRWLRREEVAVLRLLARRRAAKAPVAVAKRRASTPATKNVRARPRRIGNTRRRAVARAA